jgi:hypothetical protein
MKVIAPVFCKLSELSLENFRGTKMKFLNQFLTFEIHFHIGLLAKIAVSFLNKKGQSKNIFARNLLKRRNR